MLVTDKTPVFLFNKSQTPPPTSKVTPSHQNLVFDISYQQKLWQKTTSMGGGVKQAGVCIHSIQIQIQHKYKYNTIAKYKLKIKIQKTEDD